MSESATDTLNRNAGVITLLSSMLLMVIGVLFQASFDRLFGDLDKLKESQAVLQTRLEHSVATVQDVRMAVKDSEGRLQNLVIRVTVLEDQMQKGTFNATARR